mmetsp:Transcript_59896/g.129889  ORF Transcript_59896/g.129889 Transcript_59896/m.129889 type:complete len:100 (-) Transcript_59896:254-553(-)
MNVNWLCCLNSSAEAQHEDTETTRPRRSSLRQPHEPRGMDHSQSQEDKHLHYLDDTTGNQVSSQHLAKARNEIRKGTGFVFKADLPVPDSDEEEGEEAG